MGSICSKKEKKLVVSGGVPLNGKIKISGAKNAVLPIMAASILSENTVTLKNVPHISDVEVMVKLLEAHGVKVDKSQWSSHILKIKARNISTTKSPPQISQQMRASVLVLGPLLARCGNVSILSPGGCTIGKRPIDLHLDGLRKLGADIVEDGSGWIKTKRSERLKGSKIELNCPSVTATENILMAACLAKGVTTICNAAREPEISDLANFLNKMGAKISGAGTETLTVAGVTELTGTTHEIIADRIEAGTYAIAACATWGTVELEGISPEILKSTLDCLEQAGAHVERKDESVVVSMKKSLEPKSVKTAPYPGFPTDMQSQWLSLMCLAQGTSTIKETLFENRFKHVGELRKMGASISPVASDDTGRWVTVDGVQRLTGANVCATDLRASASLLIAALSARGRTVINDIHHLERGYEDVVQKLTSCGADLHMS